MTISSLPEPANADFPIAVVGVSCRLPGGISSPSKLWDLCAQRDSAWSPLPESRFSLPKFYHPNPGKSGCFPVRGGHFLEQDLGHFDARFFNANVQEAEAMDPQQRLLLECAYEALENAGIPMENVSNSDTGVYMASSSAEYLSHLLKDTDNISMYQPTGSLPSILSNRISYFFNLKGPSITIDTGCSASLVALHVACKSLARGESKLALVGGAHVLLGPEFFISMGMAGFFSEEGRSYAFDDRACGFGRGEGAVCVALKPLSQALQDGDSIRAVIRNTGVNQDGRTPGITMPSGESQRALIRSVYRSIGLDPADTQYVEAHGTGTAVGDPIEAKALAGEFCVSRPADEPLLIGSVKTNVGHLEGGSGLAGLIKTVLMLEKGQILPNTNFINPNPAIPMKELNIKIPTDLIPCLNGSFTRASVNGFGFGGTNAHAVVESATNFLGPIARSLSDTHPERARIYLLSAHCRESAQAQRDLLIQYLNQRNEKGTESPFLAQLAHTLSERRSKLPWKVAVQASNIQQLCDSLGSGQIQSRKSTVAPGLAFVFTGQGAQWARMGMQLITFPSFQRVIQQANDFLLSLGANWSLLDELSKNDSDTRINDSSVSQSACTAVQLGLVELLASWDTTPRATIGHSSGEIAAAYATGALDLESAMTIAYYRGALAEKAAQCHRGSMLAVGAGPAAIAPILSTLTKGTVVIACENSPESITASGDDEAIQELQSIVNEKGLFNRKLATSCAYHSHHMECIAEEYREKLSGLTSSAPRGGIRFFSSLYGRSHPAASLDVNYWVDNLVSPVKFADALSVLLSNAQATKEEEVINTLVEVGPHPALQQSAKSMIASAPGSQDLSYLPTLLRRKDDVFNMLEVSRRLIMSGLPVDINAVNQGGQRTGQTALTDLPPYPWTHGEKYWIETRYTHISRFSDFARNDILGTLKHDSIDLEPTWRNTISVGDLPWLRNLSAGTVEYPLSGYVSMAIEAVSQLAIQAGLPFSEIRLRDVKILESLELPLSTKFETQITLRPADSRNSRGSPDVRDWHTFEVFSWISERGWRRHCSGMVSICDSTWDNPIDGDRERQALEQSWKRRQSEMEASCGGEITGNVIYQQHERQVGTEMRRCLKAIQTLRTSHLGALAEVLVPDSKLDLPFQFENPVVLHPTIIEPCFQSIASAVTGGKPDTITLPRHDSIRELRLSMNMTRHPGTRVRMLIQSEKTVTNTVTTSTAFVGDGQHSSIPSLEITGLTSSWESLTSSNDTLRPQSLCYKDVWKPHPRLVSPLYFQTESRLARLGNAQTSPFLAGGHWNGTAHTSDPGTSPRSSEPETVARLIHKMGDQWRASPDSAKDFLPEILNGNLLTAYISESDKLANALESVISYIELLVHEQRHGYSILGVGPVFAAICPQLLRTLQGQITSVELGGISPAAVQAVSNQVSNFAGTITHNSLDRIGCEYDQSVNHFDLVVVTPSLNLADNFEVAVDKLQSLLKESGHIITLSAHSDRESPSVLSHQADQNGSEESNGSAAATESSFSLIEAPGLDFVRASQHCCNEEWAVNIFERSPSRKPDVPVTFITADETVPNPIIQTQKNSSSSLPTRALGELEPTEMVGQVVVMLAMESPLLRNPSPNVFAKLQALTSHCSGILWVIQGGYQEATTPDTYMAAGLCRTLRWENPGLRCALLDLDERHESVDEGALETIQKVIGQVFLSDDSRNVDLEFMERNGDILIPRVEVDDSLNRYLYPSTFLGPVTERTVADPEKPLILAPDFSLHQTDITFTEDRSRALPLDDGWVEIDIKAVPITFSTQKAMQEHRLSDLGFVYSGTVTETGQNVTDFKNGDRVCAMTTGGIGSSLRCPANLVNVIPDDMDFVEAASVYSTFLPVYYALSEAGGPRRGSVIVHNASSRLGQAALQLLQHNDVKVLATVSTFHGKELLMEKHGIAEDCILSSDSDSYRNAVLRATAGRGVDLLLDMNIKARADEWEPCLSPSGKYVSFYQGQPTSRFPRLEKNQRFLLVDMAAILADQPDDIMAIAPQVLEQCRQESLHAASPLRTFALSEANAAIQTAENADLVGDVVVEIHDEDIVKSITSKPKHGLFRSDATYLISGGTGGLGRCLARWIVDQGGKYVVLASRSGKKNGQLQPLINDMSEKGAEITVEKCDFQNSEEVSNLFQRISGVMPPVRGVIHAPWIPLYDIFERTSHESYMSAVRPKVDGAWNLHQQTLDQELGFFVLMSSVHGIFGNRGQSSTAAAHTFLDAFMQYRLNLGLPAITVDLPIIEEVGYMAENSETMGMVSGIVYDSVNETEFLSLIELAIGGNSSAQDVARAHRHHIITGLGVPSDKPLPFWMDDARFSHINQDNRVAETNKASDSADHGNEVDVRTALQAVDSRDQAVKAISRAILGKVSKLGMVPLDELSESSPLTEYGLDSISGIEIRNWIMRDLGAVMGLQDLLSIPTIADLSRKIAEQSKLLAD